MKRRKCCVEYRVTTATLRHFSTLRHHNLMWPNKPISVHKVTKIAKKVILASLLALQEVIKCVKRA